MPKGQNPVVLINMSGRAYNTSEGLFRHGETREFPAKAAEDLLGYGGIYDASQGVPEGKKSHRELRRKVADLQKEVDELKAKNAELTAKLKGGVEQ